MYLLATLTSSGLLVTSIPVLLITGRRQTPYLSGMFRLGHAHACAVLYANCICYLKHDSDVVRSSSPRYACLPMEISSTRYVVASMLGSALIG